MVTKIKAVLIIILSLLVFNLPGLNINAQNLNSNNYTLVSPTIDTNAGVVTSNNYSTLQGSSPVDGFLTSSTNYTNKGGSPQYFEANVPSIACAETSTNSGNTTCTGVPGGNGMQGVCSIPGCYDRAKLEINTQGNANDARYAIQVSTTSNFSSNIFTIAGTTHIRKTTSALVLSDFLFKCDWEGTILGTFCASANTTWQKYNILGLVPGTTYFFRIAALKGSTANGSFTQSAWSPIVSAATNHTSLSFKIDIGPTSGSTSNPPYILSMPNLLGQVLTTSTNYIIFRTSTNALNGIQVQIKGQNGSLLNGGNSIPAFSGNLSTQSSGYGIRNDSTTNSQINSGNLGNIHVSTSPIDFTDPGGIPNQVGGPTTTFNNLFDSQSLPLNTGVSAYKVKALADLSKPPGTYSETLTTLIYGTY